MNSDSVTRQDVARCVVRGSSRCCCCCCLTLSSVDISFSLALLRNSINRKRRKRELSDVACSSSSSSKPVSHSVSRSVGRSVAATTLTRPASQPASAHLAQCAPASRCINGRVSRRRSFACVLLQPSRSLTAGRGAATATAAFKQQQQQQYNDFQFTHQHSFISACVLRASL